MKKKILLVLIFIIICLACFALGYWSKGKNSEESNNVENNELTSTEDDELIKTPDRIIFKYESKYYEITPDYEKYTELVNICKESINNGSNENVSEEDINSMKSTAKFIEFDYNTISKNNIFFLTRVDIGAIQMKDSDGTAISGKLNNVDKIAEMFLEAIEGKEGMDMSSSMDTSLNAYNYLPSTADFKGVKSNKLYVKTFENADDFIKIIEQYNLTFGDFINTIENDFETQNAILILSKYGVSEYKANIGNVKIYFYGNDYADETTISSEYRAYVIMVSKIVNINCIYYNYDSVSSVDNVTGTTKNVSGVVKSKDADEITISYTTDDNFSLGRIMLSSNKITNSTVDEIKVGDYIFGTATVTEISTSDGITEYEANSITVQTKDEYNKFLEDYLMGETEINTSIVDYYSSESNYDGYVICEIYSDGGTVAGYAKFYYDFYEGYTKSYLGRAENNVDDGDYGIQLYEIVDIIFQEAVTDINNIHVKTFEFIAD